MRLVIYRLDSEDGESIILSGVKISSLHIGEGGVSFSVKGVSESEKEALKNDMDFEIIQEEYRRGDIRGIDLKTVKGIDKENPESRLILHRTNSVWLGINKNSRRAIFLREEKEEVE